MNTLERAIQVKIDEAIEGIWCLLDDGKSLEYALNVFEAETSFGPRLRAQVIAAFS